MRATVRSLLLSLLAAAFLASADSGGAQAQGEISDAKLDAFVIAAIEVDRLIQEWSPRIDAARDERQADDLRKQASAQLIAAVEATEGISIDEYKEIVRAARSDPALSGKIESLFRQRTGN